MKTARAPKVSETAEHLTIAGYFRKIGLGGHAVVFHLRGERAGLRQGMLAKRMGVVAGLPDWMVLDGGKAGFIELKPRGFKTRTARTGTYTPHERRQLDVHAALRRAGAWVEICESLEEVLDTLRHYGVPLRSESLTTERIKAGFRAAMAEAEG